MSLIFTFFKEYYDNEILLEQQYVWEHINYIKGIAGSLVELSSKNPAVKFKIY